MPKITKRAKVIREKVTPGKTYQANDAFELLKKLPPAKFDETIEFCAVLGIDSKKSDQAIRGSIVLPKGSGKNVRVAVFTSAANADKAKQAGADIVGLEDLAEKVKAGEMNFDVVIATPDAMRVIGQLGQVLGPRGLMPNPKDGTVTPDVVNAVKQAKSGQVRYRTDKAGLIHCTIGKMSFAVNDLLDNFKAMIAALRKAKPITSKGVYFKRVTVSSTMGPGLTIDLSGMDI